MSHTRASPSRPVRLHCLADVALSFNGPLHSLPAFAHEQGKAMFFAGHGRYVEAKRNSGGFVPRLLSSPKRALCHGRIGTGRHLFGAVLSLLSDGPFFIQGALTIDTGLFLPIF